MALASTGPQITIYNDNFATVKEDRTLTLQEGVSEIRVSDMSGRLEPDSVLLRELSEEPFGVKILEQSYVNDPLTQGLLMHQLEGQTILFEDKREDGTVKEVAGTIIRSGYVPGGGSEQPIIESEGAVRFHFRVSPSLRASIQPPSSSRLWSGRLPRRRRGTARLKSPTSPKA